MEGTESIASKHQSTMETLKKLLPKSSEEVMNILRDKDPNSVLESSVLRLVSNTCDMLFVKDNSSHNRRNFDNTYPNIQTNCKIGSTNSNLNQGNCEISQTSENQNVITEPTHRHNHDNCVVSQKYVQRDSTDFEENCNNLQASNHSKSDGVKSQESNTDLAKSLECKTEIAKSRECKTDFVKCRENCEILIDYIWEKLNTGYWKDVPVAWRYAYTIVSMLKMLAETHLLVDNDTGVKFSDVMKTCDMGLLMGAPLLDNILAKISACISPLNPDCNLVTNTASTVDEFGANTSPKTKRQKLTDTTVKFTHDPLCSLDETKSIQRVSCPSLESFQNNFLNVRVPVIITNAIDFWPAMSNRKWTLDYIKSVAGTRTVPIEIGSKYTEDSWSQTLMTIKDFIEKHIENPCENKSNLKGYLAQHQLFDQIPELQNDISVPTYCCLGTQDDVDVNAWFGPRGTVSPLHYDDKDNLLAQVMGSKYIRLYSDEFTPSIYPHPHRLLHNTSQVDVEQPNYHEFPKFKTAPYLECILNPGEMLFIPSKFWHFVKSLSVSFSVSFWWQ